MNEAIGVEEMVPLLQRAYVLVAELWCSPRDVEVEEVRREAGEVVRALRTTDPEAASLLARFLTHYPPPEEEYVAQFELNPRCSLYLGSHVFEEPKTCAQAAVSDRNEYMLDLIGIYKHFGLGLKGKELPDFLPLVVEALALTAGVEDPIREKLVKEYVLPFLSPLRAKLDALGTPYLHLLDALERLLKLELGVRTGRMVDDG